MKTCTKCLEEKALTEYSRQLKGFRSRCKGCSSVAHREYRIAKKDEIATQRREHYLANKGKKAAQNRKHALANKDKLAAQRREYRMANRAAINHLKTKAARRYQRETLHTATRKHAPWEPWEDAAIMDYSKTAREWALEIGRTRGSVQARRSRLADHFMNAT